MEYFMYLSALSNHSYQPMSALYCGQEYLSLGVQTFLVTGFDYDYYARQDNWLNLIL